MKLARCLPAFGLATGLAVAPLAGAAVITYTSERFWVGDDPRVESDTTFSTNLFDLELLSLQRFDASLGTLQSVEIFLQGTWEGVMQVRARDESEEGDFIPLPPFFINARNDASGWAQLTGALQFALLDPSGPEADLLLPTFQVTCSDTTRDAAGATECQNTDSRITGVDLGLALGGLATTSFVGTNPLDLAVRLTGVLSGGCDGGDRGDLCVADVSSLFVGTASVRYTYEAFGDDGSGGTGGGSGGTGGGGGSTGGDPVEVPEPGTLALLGAGLIGLALRSRRTSRGVAVAG